MKTFEPYSYTLPQERIAQRPVHPYDAARLLVLDTEKQSLEESHFYDLPELLDDSIVLVFNDTKVIPARLRASVSSGAHLELLCIEEVEPGIWRCMGKPMRKLKADTELIIGDVHTAKVLKRSGSQEVFIDFGKEEPLDELLAVHGEMPIPPYIRKGCADDEDVQDYQTMFAEQKGSIAAPTASLHFTPTLIEAIQSKGVIIRTLTLHVGPASFLPLQSDDSASLLPPGKERLEANPALIKELRDFQQQGKSIVAVGTTVVRALETLARTETCNETDLFITPGHEFSLIDGLITNFHQPGTTHLLLVQALCGRSLLHEAYQQALEHDFRFLSYGDGMYIRPNRSS